MDNSCHMVRHSDSCSFFCSEEKMTNFRDFSFLQMLKFQILVLQKALPYCNCAALEIEQFFDLGLYVKGPTKTWQFLKNIEMVDST